MGHTEHFEFIDSRDGDCGVSYVAGSLPAITVLADKVGFHGHFKHTIKAYPPRPSAEELKKLNRLESELVFDDADLW